MPTTSANALTELELIGLWEMQADTNVIRAAVEKDLIKPAIKLTSFAMEATDSAAPADAPRVLLNGIFYVYKSIPVPDQPGIIKVTAVICAEAGSTVDGQENCVRYSGRPTWLRLVPSGQLKSVAELLYTKSQANRLAEAHSLPSLDRIPELSREASPLRERERHNLLRLVGALAAMYVKGAQSNRLGTASRPNCNQIVNEIQAFLDEIGVSDDGLKSRTLNDRLPKAFRALTD